MPTATLHPSPFCFVQVGPLLKGPTWNETEGGRVEREGGRRVEVRGGGGGGGYLKNIIVKIMFFKKFTVNILFLSYKAMFYVP